MPAVTRALAIAYGSGVTGISVGGITDFLLDAKYTLTEDYNSQTVSFEVICTGSTAAGFASNCSTLERVFRIPRNDLTITLSGATLVSLLESDSSGYHADPSITKVGDEADTGRSRKYRVDIVYERPADLVGQAGRRESTVALNFQPSRRRIFSVTGRFTTVGGVQSARAVYNSAIGALTASIISSFGGTWELVSEDANSDDDDKNLDFSQTFEELIFPQSSGLLDNPAIVQSRMSWSRQIPGPGDSPGVGARRLEAVTGTIQTWVDKDVTVDIEGLWRDTIRPYLLSHAQVLFNPQAIAVVDETHSLEPIENKITGTLTLLVVGPESGGVIEYTNTVQVQTLEGLIGIPVWSGNKFAKHVYQGPADCIRTVTIRARVLGNNVVKECGEAPGIGGAGAEGGVIGAGGGAAYAQAINRLVGFALGISGAQIELGSPAGGGGGAQGQSPNWFAIINPEVTSTPLELGVPPDTIQVTDYTVILSQFFATKPPTFDPATVARRRQ